MKASSHLIGVFAAFLAALPAHALLRCDTGMREALALVGTPSTFTISPELKLEMMRFALPNDDGAPIVDANFQVESAEAAQALIAQYKAINPALSMESLQNYFKSTELAYPLAIPLEALLPAHIRDPKISNNPDVNCVRSAACFDDPNLVNASAMGWSLTTLPFQNAMTRAGRTMVATFNTKEKTMGVADLNSNPVKSGDILYMTGPKFGSDHGIYVLQSVEGDFLVYSKEGERNAKISLLSDVLADNKANFLSIYRK